MKYPAMVAVMLMTAAIGHPVDVAAQEQDEMFTAFGELRRGEIYVRGWVDDDLIDIPRENYVNRFSLVACEVKTCHPGLARDRGGVRSRDDYGLLV